MQLSLATPALLFPAISLLLLAYTNRFLTIANLIRSLHSRYKQNPSEIVLGQISNLRLRVKLIRNMQIFGITSLFLCVFCMFVLFAGEVRLGEIIFGVSLVLLMFSLGLSIREIQISVNALDIELSDMERMEKS